MKASMINIINSGPIENIMARAHTAEDREGVLEMAHAVFNEGIQDIKINQDHNRCHDRRNIMSITSLTVDQLDTLSMID